jgi:mannitol/fructose-specific phosphotransferase system IIA component (Ntr-type)
MRLADVLDIRGVRTGLQAPDKDSMLRTLADLFVSADDLLDRDHVYSVIAERERVASTGVGSGVAIPHGRMDIEGIRAVMAICPDGVPFDAVDGQPARIFLAVLAPEDHPAAQLKVLARISRVLKDEGVRRRLLDAPNGDAALAIVAEEEADY